MRRVGVFTFALAIFALVSLQAAPAAGQATRTWVSGVGDDANPCSRTAPCKTFAGAISKTAAGGIIDVLDPGAYGAITITKSITIENVGNFAGVLATLGSSGIVVNAGAGDVVVLRGLSIHGHGTGANGIRFLAGGALHVEDCTINAFSSSSVGSGHGIAFLPSGASELYVRDTVVAGNGIGTNGGGILVKPTGVGGSARVVLERVAMLNNVFGLKIDGSGATNVAGIVASVLNSEAAGNSFSGFTVLGGTQSATLTLDHSASLNNGTTGVAVGAQSNAIIRIGNTAVTGNGGTGLAVNAPGQIISFGTNSVAGNNPNGAPSSTPGQV